MIVAEHIESYFPNLCCYRYLTVAALLLYMAYIVIQDMKWSASGAVLAVAAADAKVVTIAIGTRVT